MSRLLDSETTIAVILGASDWSRAGLGKAKSFQKSAAYVQQYLLRNRPDGLGLDPDLVLSLFDDTAAASVQLARLREFIRELVLERRDTEKPIADILVYYIGHGTCDDGNTLHLLVRDTAHGIEAQTSIPTPGLARVLRTAAPQQRRICIFDCCFSEAAVEAFGAMGGLDEAVTKIGAANLVAESPSPQRGTMLLCSSPRGSSSIGLPNAERTLFTGALLRVLQRGSEGRQAMLSFLDLKEDIFDEMLRQHNGISVPRPALHQPHQQDGDLTKLPAFPNVYLSNKLAEETKRHSDDWRENEARRNEERQLEVEAKRLEEERLAAEIRRLEEERRGAEKKRLEEERRAAEIKRLEEERRGAEKKRLEEESLLAEAKRREEEQLTAEAKRQEEMRQAAQRFEEELQAAELQEEKLQEAKSYEEELRLKFSGKRHEPRLTIESKDLVGEGKTTGWEGSLLAKPRRTLIAMLVTLSLVIITMFAMVLWPGGGNALIAVGVNGTIVRSKDGGKTWVPVKSGTTDDLEAVRANPEGTALLAIGKKGAIVRSEDQGKTWMPVHPKIDLFQFSINAIVTKPQGKLMLIVGNRGTVIRSEDGGETWARVESGTSDDLEAAWADPKSKALLAFGAEGAILRSMDEGKTWTPVKSGTADYLNAVWADPQSTVLVAFGTGGGIIRSENGGGTWMHARSDTVDNLSRAWIDPQSKALLAFGDFGAIVRSEDKGMTWTTTYAGFSKNEDPAVWMPSRLYSRKAVLADLQSKALLAAGVRGRIVRSEDGGKTWRLVQSSTTENLRIVLNTPQSKALLAFGDQGVVVRSEDGGMTWTSVNSGTKKDFEAVLANQKSKALIAVGGGGAIVRSEDGGKSWTSITSGTTEDLLEVFAIPESQKSIVDG